MTLSKMNAKTKITSFKNLFVFVIALSALMLASSCKALEKVSGGEELEGWRVINEEDVFFMKISGRASERAIDRDDLGMLKSTCVEATRVQAGDRVIRKILGESLEGASQVTDGQLDSMVVISKREGVIKGTELKECAPIDSDKKWVSCECVYFVKGKGLKKKFQLQAEKLNR